MSFNSVGEILEMIGRTHDELREVVADLDEAKAGFRASPDCWTVAEILEHLATVQEGMSKISYLLLKQAGGTAAKPDVWPLDLSAIEKGLAVNFQAPENVRPKGGVGIGESLEKLQSDYERLCGMQARLEAVDLNASTFPHPAFGPLGGYHWLVLLGFHEQKHTRQIERIKQQAGFPV
ncbi:MAG: DinB family protein [Acidobacteria bacterium]|nr:DinB family protein [Acidobacteriota bacterium]MCW5967787.1 DinB family protein [Blastocatellales bacterium]